MRRRAIRRAFSDAGRMVVEFINGKLYKRAICEGEDTSEMIVGGNDLMRPEDLQAKAKFNMVAKPVPGWKDDPSYNWRRRR